VTQPPADEASRPSAPLQPTRPPSGLSLPGTRILQLLPRLESGGVEEVTLETCRFVATAGGSTLVASAGGAMVEALVAAGALHVQLPLDQRSPLALAANAVRIAALVRRERIDLIHVRSRAPAFSALWAGRTTRTPVVATYHGVYSAGSGLKRWYNAVMTRGDFTFANSSFTAAHVMAQHAIAPDRLIITPEGIDTARFDPAAVSPERLARAREAIGADAADAAPVILLPARLTGWKGQTVAIAALARLAGAGDARLVLAGAARKAQDKAVLLAVAQAAGVADRVVFAGRVEDMPALLAAADLVIAPSTSAESFGRSIAEACAMERYVIASRHGAAAELVVDGETGRLAAPGDVQAWAAAIAQALALTPQQRLEIGRQARRRMVERFSLEAMAQATLAAYRRVLGLGA
jgi:glycosyltransferase involved in cell wall biosynthesis